jgi:hypothetical protein
MAYPNIIYGDYGDERVSQSTRIGNLELGTRMVLPDGRVFAHARCSSTAAITNGVLCIGAATVAASARICSDVGASGAVGGKYINITLGGTTAVTVDQFRNGYMYKVKENDSAAVSTTCKFYLADNDSVQSSLGASTAKVGICRNEFDEVIIRAAGTAAVNIPAGVTPIPVTAGYYFWIQRRGPCAILSAGTVSVAGEWVASCTATAGGVARYDPTIADTTDVEEHHIAWCMVPGTGSTDHELDYLTLD